MVLQEGASHFHALDANFDTMLPFYHLLFQLCWWFSGVIPLKNWSNTAVNQAHWLGISASKVKIHLQVKYYHTASISQTEICPGLPDLHLKRIAQAQN